MIPPELSRVVDIRQGDAQGYRIEASTEECAALAKRFDLVRVKHLEALLDLVRDGDVVKVSGTLTADLVQSCAVSGEDLPAKVAERLCFRFVPQAKAYKPDSEVELTAEELDEIEYSGSTFDLGEAVAQSLALAIDPFATLPDADEVRRKAGLLGAGEAGPFGALKGLLPPAAE